jgi:hypothetical protein
LLEDILGKLLNQLIVTELGDAPLIDEIIHRGVKMFILHLLSLFPILESQIFLTPTESHDSLLVADISPLSNNWQLHLIERPLEEFLVVFYQ